MSNDLGIRKVVLARAQLALLEPFFQRLALKLTVVEDPTARKMWTDGVHVGFNPTWAADPNTTVMEIMCRMAEITMHNASDHPLRMVGLDPRDANKAADYAQWALLKNAKYPLPDDVYYDVKYEGLSLEAIYKMIHQEPESGEGHDDAQWKLPPQEGEGDEDQDDDASGAGEEDQDSSTGTKPVSEDDEDGDKEEDADRDSMADDPGSDGEIRPPPPGVNREQLSNEWHQAVLQAAQAAQAEGRMPKGMEQLIDSIKNPEIPWTEVLRKLVQQVIAKADYSYRQPNKRYAPQGYYLPSLRSETMPAGVLYWDTSGSRDSQEKRAVAAAEAMNIIDEARPERLIIIYGDSIVQRVEEFEPGDVVAFHPKGGGGTSFEPIFKYIEDNDLDPAFFIGITDADGSFPARAPEYPVIWAVAGPTPVPFGERIQLPKED